MQSSVTLNLGANFDDITKALKIFNKSTGESLSDTFKKGLVAPIIDFKKELRFLKSESIFATPKSKVEEMAKRIKDATNAKLELDIKRANEQIWDLRGQIIGVYASFKGLVSKPISASIDFNNAINEINRFSNFSTQELAVFKKDIWSLGKTNGVKLDDIIKTSELSAKLGIAKQDLKSFSQIALDMQVGLGLGVEQSTEIGNKLSKAFSLNTKELRTFLDETTSMSKSVGVSGQKILEVISSISSGAKAFGLSAKETSALSSAFLSVGLDSSEASSSINKFFTELNNIDNASEGFKRSLTKMGLDAQTLKEDIANNPQEAIKSLFAELNDLDDEERFGVISEIFGKKMANNINSAKDGIKAFEKALESSKDSAGALSKAVDRAAGDGFGDVVIQLSSAFKHLGVSIGNGFVPILKPIFEGIKNITNAISELLDNNKWLGISIASIIGGFTLLKGALLTTKIIFPLLNLAIYPLQATYTLLTSGVMGFIWKLRIQNIWNKITTISTYILKGAIFALNGAFKIAGVGVSWFSKTFRFAMTTIKGALISTGIGALIVGLGVFASLIVQNWKPIGAFFTGLFSGIQAGLSPLKDSFMGLWNALKTAFAPITNLLGFVFGKLFSQMDATQEKLNGWTQFGFVIGRAIGGFLYILAKPFEWLIQIITLALDGVAKATNWIENSTLGKMIFGDENKAIDVNKTTHLKGSIDEVIAKQNENKAKMLSSISSNDNSRQINDYKTITINTNANPQAIASAINSYSYDDEL